MAADLRLVSNRADTNISHEDSARVRIGQSDFGGSGGGDGMDHWQTSVNDRLASLDRKTEEMSKDLTGIKVEIATLSERVAHLPTKDYISEKFDKHLVKTGIMVSIITAILGAVLKFT